ncbi:MAG: hypothetical protein HOI59_00215 [Nitrospina sp.]|nr:hypothetical protein [Nitrospina sp.]MBT3414897.1 hypothetical protein [Nitrospina sp.]MBT3855267.1 hypothetical protein [Nitrospina sp.]MBT4105828.1 hypothetical protein [Nitrospina sp.]MBT4388071.1 hypothetical protein [Nitrospina sp.]
MIPLQNEGEVKGMLFPVTIYNAEGKVKKVLSEKMLRERHWRMFRERETRSVATKGRTREMPKGLKKKLDQEFPEIAARYYQ